MTKKGILTKHAAGLWDGSAEQWAQCVWGDLRIPFVVADGYDELPVSHKTVRQKLEEILRQDTLRFTSSFSGFDALGRSSHARYEVDCIWDGSTTGVDGWETYQVTAGDGEKAQEKAAYEMILRNEMVKEAAMQKLIEDYHEITRYTKYEFPLPSDHRLRSLHTLTSSSSTFISSQNLVCMRYQE